MEPRWSEVLEKPEENHDAIALVNGRQDTPDQLGLELVTASTSKLDFTIMHIRKKGSQSPFLYMLSFSALRLKKELFAGIYMLGLLEPTKLQRYFLPVALNSAPHVNMFVQAEWDTGKRTAFILAMLNVIDPTKEYPQAICLSSSSELVLQNVELAIAMAKFYPSVKFCTALERMPGELTCKLSEQVIFGTPDYVASLGYQWKAFDYNKIKLLVLQDVDSICNIPDFHEKSFFINQSVNKQCQKLFFASVYNTDLNKILPSMMLNPYILKSKCGLHDILNNVSQFCVLCRSVEEKNEAVMEMIRVFHTKPILIFCSNSNVAKTLAVKIILENYDVTVCSGDLNYQQRVAIYKRICSGDCKILIATDVLTRGIHLKEFGIVCNYDVPDISSPITLYTDRVTRAGRSFEKGVVLNLIDSEASLSYYRAVEATFMKIMINVPTNEITNIYRANLIWNSRF